MRWNKMLLEQDSAGTPPTRPIPATLRDRIKGSILEANKTNQSANDLTEIIFTTIFDFYDGKLGDQRKEYK
jgi:hypothetical protein